MNIEPEWKYKGTIGMAPVKIADGDGPMDPILAARAPKWLMPLAERWFDLNEFMFEFVAEVMDALKPGSYETYTKKLTIHCRIDGTPLQPGDYGYNSNWKE